MLAVELPCSSDASIYGMRRTTVYLHDAQAARLKRVAARRGRSEADLIREGVDRILQEMSAERPRPRLPGCLSVTAWGSAVATPSATSRSPLVIRHDSLWP